MSDNDKRNNETNYNESYSLLDKEEDSSIDDCVQCKLCDSATQHSCTKCLKPVCNLFCSEQDPNSSNEMVRRHKQNDPRCKTDIFIRSQIVSNSTCALCDKVFETLEDMSYH